MVFSPVPRIVKELQPPDVRLDACYRVMTARVVFANYELLQSDFPHLRDHALLGGRRRGRGTKAEKAEIFGFIDAWLLRHAALVAEAQCRPNRVNTPIRVFPEPIPAYRPPRYGRAAVVSIRDGARPPQAALGEPVRTEPDGLLDLKGVGVARGAVPSRRMNSSGLLTMAEALVEYANRELLQAIFLHAGARFRVIPVYAILDLGFDTYRGEPVGLVVRRAHRRYPGELPAMGTTRQLVGAMVEMLLRQYGVSSTHMGRISNRGGRYRYEHHGRWWDTYTSREIRRFLELTAPGKTELCFDLINIQTTASVSVDPPGVELKDFDHYRVSECFTEPVMMQVCNRLFGWGGWLHPGHPAFVQPDSRYAVRSRDWGTKLPTRRDVAELGLMPDQPLAIVELVGRRLARAFRLQKLSGAEVKQQIEAHVQRATRRCLIRPRARRDISAVARAQEAAEAICDSGAALGPAMLGLFEDRGYARTIDAGETLIAFERIEMLGARIRSGHASRSAEREVARCARRLLGSGFLAEAEEEMKSGVAHGRSRAQPALIRTTRALEALTRLRAGEATSTGELLEAVERIAAAEAVRLMRQKLVAVLQQATGGGGSRVRASRDYVRKNRRG